MFFTDFTDEKPDNKQRLNLSEHAYQTLISDASVFFPEEEPRTESGGIPSGILNRVFFYFAPSAESSISSTLKHHRTELEQILADLESGPQKGQAISLLLAARRNELAQRCAERLNSKGRAFSFRIDKDNMEFLASDIAQEEAVHYGNSVGTYFKAVLEEYASLPYFQREQIFYTPQLATIHRAITEEKRLRLTVRYSRLTPSQTMYMKPYALRQDAEKKYNYLLGMLSFDPDGDVFQCASVRLTSIVRCTRLERTGIVKAADRREIEARIKKSGVPYLSSGKHTQIIKVYLTDNGVKMYNSILHLRPQFMSRSCIDGKWVYTFDCLPWQAEIYFFKFGPDARILEPQPLADQLYEKYSDAVKLYLEPM